MAITVEDVQVLIEVLETRPEWRDRFRLLVVDEVLQEVWNTLRRVTESLGELAEAQQRAEERLSRLEAVVGELAEAQRRTEERVNALAEAQQRAEERLSRLEAGVAELAEPQRRTEEQLSRLETAMQTLIEQVDRLVGWQQGTAGRLEGEHYERLLVKRAPTLFNRGTGGATDNPLVQQWLTEKLDHLLADLTDEENPFLADLIWRKGDQVLVVEASIHVDRRDVQRAAQRAEVLRRAGLQARGMVVGEAWFGPSVREQAQALGIEWKVGDDYSEGWIAFRRLKETGEESSR